MSTLSTSSAGGGGAPAAPRAESITQLTQRIKRLLEGGVEPCWVRGEVSNLRIQASGHVYFSLKDPGAQISAVMFRGDALRQEVRLREGLQVLAFGQLSLYEPRGQYQLVVRTVADDGMGRLQREFEELKRRLAAEGLFDPATKRPIPPMPARVGFITSPTGAAVRDFMRILERRGWRGRAVVLPCKVQGDGAAAEMSAMLSVVGALVLSPAGLPVPRTRSDERAYFDLLVIGRGGGSMEDLNAFNEEILVRAVAACPIPIISAVGHETDVTLCDFAADARAETPSGAAELVSSGFVAAAERCSRLASHLNRELAQGLLQRRRRIEALAARLRLLSPAARVERGWLRLDDLGGRLEAALVRALEVRRRDLREASLNLRRNSPEKRIALDSHRLLALWKRLQAASPQSVLNRGFVILRDEQGRPVSRLAEAPPIGAKVSARFADGDLALKVGE